MGVLGDFALMEVGEPNSKWLGRSLGEIAGIRGTDIIDVLLDVVLIDAVTLLFVLPSLTPSLGRSDEGWRVRVSVWKDPRVMLGGSDAGAHLDLMCHANYPTVVLGEVVRDRGLLSLEEAVEMMTDRPARHYGLRHRGRVAEGWFADLVVFDPMRSPLGQPRCSTISPAAANGSPPPLVGSATSSSEAARLWTAER
jgi:N-acyl-D-aspartate/D-glutamate deacylase